MEKNFMSMLLIIPTIYMSSMYTAEEQISMEKAIFEKKVNLLLRKTKDPDTFYSSKPKELSKKIPPKITNTIQDILKIFEDSHSDGSEALAQYKDDREVRIYPGSAGIKTTVVDGDGSGQIIDFKNKIILVQLNNIRRMHLNPDGTRIAIVSRDDKGLMINLENQRIFFEGDNIKSMELSSDGKVIAVLYTDGTVQNINSKNGRELIKRGYL